MTVAVIDTGVAERTTSYVWRLWNGRTFSLYSVPYAMNPDLNTSEFLPGRDYQFFTAGSPVLDMVGHGTHVAGTILQATNNAIGVSGIAYRSRLLPLKVCEGYWEFQILLGALGQRGFVPRSYEGGCETASVVAAIRYAADQGAKVINLSLGGPNAALAYREALRYAVDRGAFVSIAVGNEFEEGNPVEYPAAYAAEIQGAMAVGAVGPTSRRAYYSNTGPHVEIVAPGGDVRVGGPAAAVQQAGLDGRDFNPAAIRRPSIRSIHR